MRFYYSTFIVAFMLIAVAVVCAFIPEIRENLRRFRRVRSERHVIKRDDEEPGPRPARPDLRRETVETDGEPNSRPG
jgi:hypothetical protein